MSFELCWPSTAAVDVVLDMEGEAAEESENLGVLRYSTVGEVGEEAY